MANVLTVVWFLIAWVVTQTAVLVWASLMLPNAAVRAREQVESRPTRAFWLGLLFWGVTVFFAIQLLKHERPGPIQLAGWISFGPMLACSVVGGAGFVRILAERMAEHAPGLSSLARLALGALCLSLCGLLPVIGWFVFMPVVGWISVGSGLQSFLRRRERRKVIDVPLTTHAPDSFVLTSAPGQG